MLCVSRNLCQRMLRNICVWGTARECSRYSERQGHSVPVQGQNMTHSTTHNCTMYIENVYDNPNTYIWPFYSCERAN